MNRICIDTRKYSLNLQDKDFYFLESFNNSDIDINILDNSKVTIFLFFKENTINLNINIGKNSYLTINQLGINSSINYSFYNQECSHLFLVDSILSSIDSINEIIIKHQGISCQSNVFTNGINLDNNKLYFKLDGIIPHDSRDSLLNENSKIINIKDGDSKIIPNLLIDTKEVIANHSAFIGNFDLDTKYYMMSRGINEDEIEKLLVRAFLLSNMQDEARKIFIERGNLYE